MLTRLKDAAKRLPYPVFLRLYYVFYLSRDLRRSEAARRKAGLPPLGDCDLSRYKRSDVLFVFGGGTSINQISAERWQAISGHDSLGLNWWLVHPFVPTYYLFEAIEQAASPDSFARFVEIANRRAADYRDTPKIAMELWKPGRLTIQDFSPEFRQNMYAAYNLPAPARTVEELEYTLRYLRSKGWFRPQSRFSTLMKYAASVTSTLVFALKLEYRTVVLCGIDITTQEYFYQDAELFPEWKDWEYLPRNQRHEMDLKLEWRIPVTQTIQALRRQLLQPAGVELFVENRSSALYPNIPEAPASLFEMPAAESSGR